MAYDDVPKTAVLATTFFVASLIHIPIGPAQIHLVLNGLAGVILGWSVFPALLVALFLQTLFFSFGGISVLGVNTVIMGLPAILCFYLFGGLIRKVESKYSIFVIGFAIGTISISLSAVLLAGILFAANEEFWAVSSAVLVAHIPVLVIEGILTGAIVAYLKKICPEIFVKKDQ